MEVRIDKAVGLFFGSSSFEMIFIEAIANSLDAGATEINIGINANLAKTKDTLSVDISDNGVGFTDERYKRFSKLFDVDEDSHKGVGRLIYLVYFNDIKITSFYEETKQIEFHFNESFDAKNAKRDDVPSHQSSTIVSMTDYKKTKLGKNDFIEPAILKGKILDKFITRLFDIKKSGGTFNIKISLNTGKGYNTESITCDDIPKFEEIVLDIKPASIVDPFILYYSIEKVDDSKTSLISSLKVDDRTQTIELISKDEPFFGYRMIFILYSDWFKGRIDFSRQKLLFSENDEKSIKSVFMTEVTQIIESKIPGAKERINREKEEILNKYPHLSNYIQDAGYISDDEVLKKAQERLFKESKELLDASDLTDEQFEKSIALSSNVLTEYILFRQQIIKKLRETNKSNKEADIHNLFIPKGKILTKESFNDDFYYNNAWLLDDKYMIYDTILSDKEMGKVVEYITQGEVKEKNADRPDIVLIFSSNPNQNEKKIDVVIIELKKRGLPLNETMITQTQLVQRATHLMKYYDNRIQRIWFYGIIEFNKEIERHLRSEFNELYSSGKMYYRETNAVIEMDPDIKLPIGVYIIDLDSIIADADTRNSVFLNLIKRKMKNYV